jgi:hypothetical protein
VRPLIGGPLDGLSRYRPVGRFGHAISLQVSVALPRLLSNAVAEILRPEVVELEPLAHAKPRDDCFSDTPRVMSILVSASCCVDPHS